MKTWRLIIDSQPLPGFRNMAIDEYLLLSLPEEKTVVRFYRWEKPTASLGRGQKVARVLDLEACRRLGVDVVRRPTGGKLVLHHQEVTYSICSSDTAIFTDTLAGSYRLISLGLIEGLKLVGLAAVLAPYTEATYSRSVWPCFARPAQNEVVVAGKKIIGSAQRRLGTRFLQHGSIPLAPQSEWLRKISRLEDASLPLEMISVEEALGQPMTFELMVPLLVEGLKRFFQIEWEISQLTESEAKEVENLERLRYANPAWTFHS
jgi:lipoate-protein ligase A